VKMIKNAGGGWHRFSKTLAGKELIVSHRWINNYNKLINQFEMKIMLRLLL